MIELRKKTFFFFSNNIEKIFTVFVKIRFEVKRRKVTENIHKSKPSYLECNFSTGTRQTSTIYYCVIMCLNCALTNALTDLLKRQVNE